MKKYMNDNDRKLEAQTLSLARMVAHLANLELDTRVPILPPEFADYLTAPDAHVVIVSATLANGNDRPKVENVMRMARCDAIMVRVVPQAGGTRKILFEIGRDGLIPVWFSDYTSRAVDGELFFQPTVDPDGPLFKLSPKGLMCSNDFAGIRWDGW